MQGLDLGVSVNLSAADLLDAELPGDVGRLLDAAGLEAHVLELEVTESAAMADPQRTREVLLELSGRGVSIAIDDFGTGYSSLAYLKSLPVDTLKIDRSFVQGMTGDTGRRDHRPLDGRARSQPRPEGDRRGRRVAGALGGASARTDATRRRGTSSVRPCPRRTSPPG